MEVQLKRAGTPSPRVIGIDEIAIRKSLLLVERFDRVPIQLQFRCHIFDRRRPAATADVIGKALGVERIVGQKVVPLPLHLATAATVEASHLQFKNNPRVAARQIAHAAHLAIHGITFRTRVEKGLFGSAAREEVNSMEAHYDRERKRWVPNNNSETAKPRQSDAFRAPNNNNNKRQVPRVTLPRGLVEEIAY